MSRFDSIVKLRAAQLKRVDDVNPSAIEKRISIFNGETATVISNFKPWSLSEISDISTEAVIENDVDRRVIRVWIAV